jgi:type I restriction enzyme M protein
MFIQSDRFVSDHGGKRSDISLFGQESNPTTWKLAAMNLAIHGIEADLGSKPGDTLRGDLHPDLKADHILANPPFNLKDWGQQALANDVRWTYGIPPASNANFAWLQHIVHHLAPGGMAGVVLANGAMSSTSSGEDATRRAMVEDDLIDCMVALPSQLFFNTQIPACLWFLTKSKQAKEKGRDRRGEVLFIDARKLGQMQSRVLRVLTDADIARITKTYRNWRGHGEGTYEDVPGFCKSASLAEIAQHGYVLTPGRYVGASVDESDDETFVEKMEQLTEQLAAQFAASAQLETQIRENLERIGYGW